MKLFLLSALAVVANAQIYGVPIYGAPVPPPPPAAAYPVYGGYGYGGYGSGYGGGYGYAGPTPYQEPYLPAAEEFGCKIKTKSKIFFHNYKSVYGFNDGRIGDNFAITHKGNFINYYECLCDAFSNPILNVCRQKLKKHESAPSVYGTSVPGAGTVGPLPSKRSPFPPAQPDGRTDFKCKAKIEVYIPFTSPLPWEKHYDTVYQYRQHNYLECQCDTGGAPLMDTCRQIVDQPVPVNLPAGPAARWG